MLESPQNKQSVKKGWIYEVSVYCSSSPSRADEFQRDDFEHMTSKLYGKL